ncbi:hypothetical protein SAMN05216403_1622 [Nitrosospira multiformis ATCC 25196]|uniref:Uncharacterized protein n=1 Tax=Nitrosospira multiformis (strain ATCC 25196 / NCIMB 11849 / C 71) TaxID=323848 RepID=A0A1H5YCF8_NITMU|nr:hypothetical protein SAMN05216403_1622 [Nitrosospira multiformis ATCC 25196]
MEVFLLWMGNLRLSNFLAETGVFKDCYYGTMSQFTFCSSPQLNRTQMH